MIKFKRYDPAKDPAATDFIPVARAAALLHDRLYPGHSVKEAETLDRLAFALAEVVPMYLRADNGAMRTVDKAVIARGRFTRGATRLEFGDDGEPLRFLLVSRRELDPAIDRLASGSSLRAA